MAIPILPMNCHSPYLKGTIDMAGKTIMEKAGIASLKDFFNINLGLLLIAVGLHFFRNPNNFAMGGVSGLAVVVAYFVPGLNVGSIMLVINVALLVVALVFLGREFVIKTVYCSLALSGIVLVLESFVPMTATLTDNKLMELIYGVFIPGIGLGLVLETGATTGGTDILAKIISKYFKLKMSIGLMISDMFIVIASVFVFGIETGLYSFMGLMLSVYVLDIFLESLQIRKIMVIISEKSEVIEDYIIKQVSRGATVHEAVGSYKKDKKRVITTVVSRGQARMLQDFIKDLDPNAFITITNSSSIIGTGFKKFD